MKLHVTPRAAADIDRLLTELASVSPSGKAAVGERLEAIFAQIAQFPFSGRLTNKQRLLYVNLHPHPYLVFYRVYPNDVRVIAIRHGARNPSSMPARPR